MRKGFTLIELLAVIVILAIIAVIAVPIVIDIIEDTKINSVKSSASMYLKATELYISNAELNKVKIKPGTYPITKEGDICIGIIEEGKCNGEVIKIDVKGSKPSSGQIIIGDNTKIRIADALVDGYACSSKKNNFICLKGTKEKVSSKNGWLTIETEEDNILSNYRVYGNTIQNEDVVAKSTSLGDYASEKNKYRLRLKVIGKNLFDKDSFLKSNYIGIYNGYNVREIQLRPNIQYKINIIRNNGYDGKSAYVLLHNIPEVNVGSEYTCISHKSIGVFSYKSFLHTSDANGKLYIGEAGDVSDINEVWENTDVQIELGETSTEYEPYRETVYDIYINEPLRCINDVCDYIDFLNGKVVRKIGVESDGTLKLLDKVINEDVDLPTIELKKGINHVYVDSNITPTKLDVEYYK